MKIGNITGAAWVGMLSVAWIASAAAAALLQEPAIMIAPAFATAVPFLERWFA